MSFELADDDHKWLLDSFCIIFLQRMIMYIVKSQRQIKVPNDNTCRSRHYQHHVHPEYIDIYLLSRLIQRSGFFAAWFIIGL